MKVPAHSMGLFILLSCSIAYLCTQLVADAKSTIHLSSTCPPYFELTAGVCEFRTIYQTYPSRDKNWGGYRIALPKARDGFTPEQVDLGRLLFFDPVLSAERNLSCAHCHHPSYGLSDGRERSSGRFGTGIGPQRKSGKDLMRGAPALWNLAFRQRFMWDGRAASLEEQLRDSLFSPNEMANDPESIVRTLTAIADYRRLFKQAFGKTEIQYWQVEKALVAFQTSLVSINSPYDRYVHGASDALTSVQKQGLNIFRSFATRCSQCHSPPLFTSNQFAITGVPTPTGLPFDPGAAKTFNEQTLNGAFLVPSLRNIARTAPYMHTGEFQTLSDVVNFYNDEPGHSAPKGEALLFHWHLVNPQLTQNEQRQLLAFLTALTDETALPEIPDRLPSGLPVPKISHDYNNRPKS